MGTAGTYGTNATAVSLDTEISIDTKDLKGGLGSNNMKGGALDDDGNLIPPVLLEHQQRRREKRRVKRKRVVKFDYPPVSSLRECPRPDPNDLPDLFFTEEELDEIELDRENTTTADDVEIVAALAEAPSDEVTVKPPSKSLSSEDLFLGVLSSKSGSSDMAVFGDHPKGAPRAGVGWMGGVGFQLKQRPYQPTPCPPSALAASPRFTKTESSDSGALSPPPPLTNVRASSASRGEEQPPAPVEKPNKNRGRNKKKKDKSEEHAKILHGVQIYLRERSTAVGRDGR
jgi:hypothetical protein